MTPKEYWNQPNIKIKQRQQQLIVQSRPDVRKKQIAGSVLAQNKSEQKEKLRNSKLGERNPLWNGGSSLIPYKKDYNIIFKKMIKLRDNNCIICGRNDDLQIHHIDYNKFNTVKENCITLCRQCHIKTNFNRPNWKIFFQNYLIEKYKYCIHEVS